MPTNKKDVQRKKQRREKEPTRLRGKRKKHANRPSLIKKRKRKQRIKPRLS